jgi:hypothetical protein
MGLDKCCFLSSRLVYGTGERGRSSEEADAIAIDAGGRDNVSMSTAHSIFWLFRRVEVQRLD